MPVRSKKNRGSQKKAQGSYRIIAGKWRGRRLAFPDAPGLRPTTDRVRETVFNWLTPLLPGASVLDLFAGSGALGLEALSRGAGSLTSIDCNVLVTNSIKQNLKLLDTDAELITQDAIAWLDNFQGQGFDVIFVDPPFRQGLTVSILTKLNECGVVKPGGRIYLEQENELEMPPLPEGWRLLKEKQAGQLSYRLFAAASE